MKHALLPFNTYCAWGYDASFIKMLDRLNLKRSKVDVVAHNLAQIKNIISCHRQDTLLGTSIMFLNVTAPDGNNCCFYIGLLPFSKHQIFKHERTMHSKTDMYEQLMKQHQLQVSPIMLLRNDADSFDILTDEMLQTKPVRSYIENDIRFDLHACTDPAHINEVQSLTASGERFFLADGHHRFSYFEKHVKEYPLCMVALTTVSRQNMSICPRAFHNPKHYNDDEIQNRIEKNFYITENTNQDKGDYVLFWNEKRLTLRLKETFHSDNNLCKFSSFITDELIFRFSFGHNAQTDADIRGIPGQYKMSDIDNVIKNITGDEDVLVFPPLFDKQLLLDYAAHDFFLPSTSTCFFPKIPDGLFVFDASQSRVR